MTSEYYCKKCDVNCCKLADWDRHVKTKKHFRNINKNEIKQSIFECNICEYKCCKQSIFNKHLVTNKHLSNTSVNRLDKSSEPDNEHTSPRNLSSQIGTFTKCSEITPKDFMSVINTLLSQNNELKNFIIDQANEHKKEAAEYKKETSEIVNKVIEQANEHKKETLEIVNKVIEQTKTINNTTITNNKAFNINMYLNEQCKDAMNFSDFINGIEVSHEDLENNAQLGFVGGVSKILIDNLKLMNRNERPIHCTDAKRETMYIKDDNKWTKEETDSKLRSAIQEITRKSISSLMAWKRGNPESDDMDSEFSSRCIVIQQQSMAGYNREVYYPKVIHAIAREVLVLKP